MDRLSHARDVCERRTWDRLRGASPIGDIVPVVVAGVATCQGGREGRPQGQGAQVIGHQQDQEVCEMQDAEMVLGVLRDGQPTAQAA